MSDRSEKNQFIGSRLEFAAIILAVFAVGMLLTVWTIKQADRKMRDALLQRTRMLAASLDIERVKMLSGIEKDLEKPEYLRLKEQLGLIRASDTQYRSIYIIGGGGDGRLFFLVDDQPQENPDKSPNGIFFDDSVEWSQKLGEYTNPKVIGPFKDREGRYVCACFPLTDTKLGKPVALLAVDFNARSWRKDLVLAAMPALLLTFTIIVVLGIGRSLLIRRARLGEQPAAWMSVIEPLLIFALGAALTFFMAWILHQQEHSYHKDAFAQLAVSRIDAIADRFRQIRNIELEGFANFFESSENVTLEELQLYTIHLTRIPAVQAWEWIPAVQAKNRANMEAEIRASGDEHLRIWQMNEEGQRIPAAGRDVYYPVAFAAPLEGNEAAIGYDLGSEPLRRIGLEAAVRSRLITATDPITLAQETGNQRAILVYRPVFDSDDTAKLQGLVLAVLRMETLLQTSGPEPATHIALGMLHPGGITEPLAICPCAGQSVKTDLTLSCPVLAFGKVFIVDACAAAGFMNLHPAQIGWIALFVGLLVSAVLAAGIHRILRGRENLERQVAMRTRDLLLSEERLRAQAAELEREKWRLQNVIEGTNVGSWEWNVQTGETIFNERWAQIIGYTLEELSPVSIETWMRYAHPEDLETSGKLLALHFDRKLDYYEYEARMRHKDGHWIWVFDRGKVFSWTEDGRPLLMYGTHQDITARKQAEKELQESNRKLEAANKELESFSYTVSHDLRAPLRGIDGFSRILLEDYADKLDEEGKDSLKRVRAATQRMGQLIDGLLKLSRITRSEITHEHVNLSGIAHVVMDELQKAEPDRRVEQIIQEEVFAHGDRTLLHAMLENLLGNAWKFTSKREIARIEFGVLPHVSIPSPGGIEEENEGIAYYVKDNGAGFDMTYVDKLFGTFQRLHTDKEFPGTGIGLATVQRIIHHHGGTIWAEGEVDQGATIYFTLP